MKKINQNYYGIIYKITNLINNKIYIGQTIQDFKNYWGSGVYITRALRKYNKENFKKEIIKYCYTEEELNKYEIFYIKEYNSIYPNGYNLQDGGYTYTLKYKTIEEIKIIRAKAGLKHKGKIISEEQKAKISATLKKRVMSNEYKEKIRNILIERNKKMIWTAQMRNKVGERLRGKKLPQEWKKNISKALIGNKYCLGIKHTEEYKKKMSLALIGKNKGKKHPYLIIRNKLKLYPPSYKAVIQLSYVGEYLEKYKSMTSVAEKYHYSLSKMSSIINKKKFDVKTKSYFIFEKDYNKY